MSIQTVPGFPNLDATDFQIEYAGKTVGIELRYVPTPDGFSVCSVLGCEKINGTWTFSQSLAQDFLTELGSTVQSVTTWVKESLIPIINAWLKTIFLGVVVPPQDNIPQSLKILDMLLPTIKVNIVDNVPQVSL